MGILKDRTIFLFTVFLFSILFSNLALAQISSPQIPVKENFKAEEIQSFIKANQKVVYLEKTSEDEMIKAMREEGFTVERFNEIAAAQQTPEKQVKIEQEEIQSFNNVIQKVADISKTTENKMSASIEEEGLDVVTYQQIVLAYQNSAKVKHEVDALLAKK
ncbi:MAG TPA: DUF4168 domain-containing protein [Pseudosphingobacterium sp.]|nr:DUF4168 domain-containing protein [Pseudosphingobacterium sp.]